MVKIHFFLTSRKHSQKIVCYREVTSEGSGGKRQPKHKKGSIDLLVGGEGREDFFKKSVRDVWNRKLSNLWRSDTVLDATSSYNEINAVSEVS